MYLLGFDIGSSSIKVSLINADNGVCEGTFFYPEKEMAITAPHPGWAEQEPEMWWENLKYALAGLLQKTTVNKDSIIAIGISYQMHGLVITDINKSVIRPAVIWCDSRATNIGNKAFENIGKEKCLETLLNSPGNFTASKLKWVKDNEPHNFDKIDKVMLPGDFIALKLTGETKTTASGLSEGIMWDFKNNCPAGIIFDYFGFPAGIIPEIVPTFSVQGELTAKAAAELNLKPHTKISYRAGDQPNNAFSLNVLNPGEIAATAGTSGVVYGVSKEVRYDPQSRVNTFAHVNHNPENPRLGVLLCINGTGILNAWLRRIISDKLTYDEMNMLAGSVPAGSEGLSVLPFGNGAERILNNSDPGAVFAGINFNIHSKGHLIRAAHEGIVFSFKYGMDIMKKTGISPSVIRAGMSNMFLSPVFYNTLAGISGAIIELYNTDGAAGAALGAGIGCGHYASPEEAFSNLKKMKTIEPDYTQNEEYLKAYSNWKTNLKLYNNGSIDRK
ncbi:MAG: FGGY family carbohydrate kinase [Prolixibacteraceae bacterium]|nr:FGGY family carbohydrate kinase [Prolixibacteraceae bacterium]